LETNTGIPELQIHYISSTTLSTLESMAVVPYHGVIVEIVIRYGNEKCIQL
jgi:hypothetical protein